MKRHITYNELVEGVILLYMLVSLNTTMRNNDDTYNDSVPYPSRFIAIDSPTITTGVPARIVVNLQIVTGSTSS